MISWWQQSAMVRSISHVIIVNINIHCWVYLMTGVKLLAYCSWLSITSYANCTWIIGLLSFISRILWYYIISWTTFFKCMRIYIIALGWMIGPTHTKILSLYFVRCVDLEVTIVRIFLRRVLLLLWLVFICCIVMRSYVFIHTTNSLVMLFNLFFTGLVVRL